MRQADARAGSQQPKTYPHPQIPAARLFFVILCFSIFSSTWGNPEVGGGDNLFGFLQAVLIAQTSAQSLGSSDARRLYAWLFDAAVSRGPDGLPPLFGWTQMYQTPWDFSPGLLSKARWHADDGFPLAEIRGNRLSNTTCLTQVFFKSGEQRSKPNQPY